MSHEQISPAYRWIDAPHPDITFFNLPRPLPWPIEADRWDPYGDFPFGTLRRGIELIEDDPSAPAMAAWMRVKELLADLDQLSIFLENGDLDSAETALGRMERAHPKCPMVWYNLAFVLKQRRRFRAALRAYRKASQLAPSLEYIWMRRAELEEQLGMKQCAIGSYKMALRLLPGHAMAQPALARLGVLREVHRFSSEKQWQTAYLTPARFRKLMMLEIERGADDPARLRRLLDQFLAGGEGKLAMAAAERLLAASGEDSDVQRLCGEAAYVAHHYNLAARKLQHRLETNPQDAKAHYYLALTCKKLKQHTAYKTHLLAALASDPNLMPAITTYFKLKPKMRDVEREEKLCGWAQENRSAQGFFIGSLLARDRGDRKLSLTRAARAHELARDDRQLLLHYTSELMECDEKEWVAALIKPRLTDGPGDFELKYQFGHALYKLGLQTEAIKILRATLEAHPTMPRDWRDSFEASLDRWEGRIAISEIEVEFYEGGTVRRPIVVVVEGIEVSEILPGGVSAPLRRMIEVEMEEPCSTASICLQQGWQRGWLEPISLGCFQMHGIDPEQIGTTRPHFWIGVNRAGQLEVGARQGARSLSVSWSLYPVPMAA